MGWKRAGLLMVGLFVVASCSGGGTKQAAKSISPSPSPSPTPSPSLRPVSRSDLLKAILTIKDIPTGFHVQGRYRSEGQLSKGPGILLPCNRNIYKSIPATATVGIEFLKRSGLLSSESFFETLRSYPTEADAARFLRAYEKANQCGRWNRRETDGTTTKIRVSELSFPELGDGSLAYTYQLDNPDAFAVEQNRVIIRMGTVILIVSHGATLEPDTDALETVTKKAVERVAKYTGWAE